MKIGEVMTFFLEIDLASSDITKAVGRRSDNRLARREFDTPGLDYRSATFSWSRDKVNSTGFQRSKLTFSNKFISFFVLIVLSIVCSNKFVVCFSGKIVLKMILVIMALSETEIYL